MSVIANNRFLQRTNPVMRAAITDGGSVLANEYIQRSARQMVNKDIYQYLVDWNDRDLVKTRTSGSDLYIPKAYDISPKENDGVQADTTMQPLLEAKGMKFDGSNDFLDCGVDTSLNTDYGTILCWVKFSIANAGDIFQTIYGRRNTSPATFALVTANGDLRGQVRPNSAPASPIGVFSGVAPAQDVWYGVALTFNGTSLVIYVNGSMKATTLVSPAETIDTSSLKDIFISKHPITASFVSGAISDLRIFNTALSATDIKDIHDLTNSIRSYYV